LISSTPSPPRPGKREQGSDGETRALRHLEQAGLKLVTRNWHCKGGEIDLVMRLREMLVLVEVRQRSHEDFGGALASIDRRKRRRIVHAARAYLARHPECAQLAIRFDVVAIEADDALEWLPNAFDADDA